jgi:hypothetical protein
MNDPRRTTPILAALILVLAACGGGGGTTSQAPANATAAGQSQAPGVEPSQAAIDAPSPDAVATTSAAPSVAEPAAGGGGGPATGVCELVTADELRGILGVSVRLTLFAGPPDTCDIQSTDGAPLAATVLTAGMSGVSASFVFDAFAGSPTASQVSGIGEKAAYDPSQGVLLVLKNGAVLSIAVFDDGSGSTDEATRLDQMKQIGAAAAGRM